MGHVGGDVEKVAGTSDEVVLKPIAIPAAGFAAQDVDRCFVIIVLVRLRAIAGRQSHKLQMKPLCAGRLRGDAWRAQVSLLADKLLACANDTAGRLCIV
jgi:hypothetical protein